MDDTVETPPPRHAGLSRREVLALGAALPAGLLVGKLARAQGFTQAPIAPKDARGNLEHRFWRDILEDFPLEPGEHYLTSADRGIPTLQTLERIHGTAVELAAHAVTRVDDPVDAARTATARFFGTEAREIALMDGATQAMAAIGAALPLAPKAPVAISTQAPPCVLTPWVALAHAGRVELRPVTPSGPDAWRAALANVKALVVSHVDAASGSLLPLADLCTEARKRGVLVVVDGSLAAGIVPLDLHALEADVYIAPANGFLLGPEALAILYVRESLLPRLSPELRPAETVLSGAAPGIAAAAEFEVEPRSPSQAAGLTAALEYLSGLSIDVVREHATILARQILSGTTGVAGLELLCTEASIAEVPIVSIRVTKRPYSQVAVWLRQELAVRVHPVVTPGLNCVRASPHLVNRKQDIDPLIEGLRRLAIA